MSNVNNCPQCEIDFPRYCDDCLNNYYLEITLEHHESEILDSESDNNEQKED